MISTLFCLIKICYNESNRFQKIHKITMKPLRSFMLKHIFNETKIKFIIKLNCFESDQNKFFMNKKFLFFYIHKGIIY